MFAYSTRSTLFSDESWFEVLKTKCNRNCVNVSTHVNTHFCSITQLLLQSSIVISVRRNHFHFCLQRCRLLHSVQLRYKHEEYRWWRLFRSTSRTTISEHNTNYCLRQQFHVPWRWCRICRITECGNEMASTFLVSMDFVRRCLGCVQSCCRVVLLVNR